MMVAQQRIITPTCKPRAMASVMKHDHEESDGDENPKAVENELVRLDHYPSLARAHVGCT
jgi:hypothetical protein